jgi:hypothetical protein
MVISPRLKNLSLAQPRNWIKDLAKVLHRIRSEHAAYWQAALRTALGLVLAAVGYTYVLAFAIASVLLVNDIANTLSIEGENADAHRVLTQLAVAWLCTLMAFYLANLKTSGPSGRTLGKPEAPELFALVEQLRTEFGSPAIGRIVLTPDYELELVRRPRSIYPFLFENVLVIGLPLLESLSPVYLKVLLARRIGHLAHSYRRPGAWLYHLGFAWEHHRRTFAHGWGPNHLIMRAFFSWYAPLFRAATRHTARNEELHADGCAMQIINDYDVAEAMSMTAVGKTFFEQRFLRGLLKQASTHPAPPYLPYSGFPRAIRKGLTQDRLTRLLNRAWVENTPPGASAPALRERLEAIGHSAAPVPALPGDSAATSLLGDALRSIQKEMDAAWFERHRDRWAERFKRAHQERVRLRTLLRRLSARTLSECDTRECTRLIHSHVEDSDGRTRLYKLILSRHPKDARIGLFIGRYLLSINDADGVQALEDAMRSDDRIRPTACQIIAQFMAGRGKEKYAQIYLRRAQE